MQGLHFSDTLAGRVFSQSATPLGLAIPIYTATAIVGSLPLFNPPGSNRIIELVSVDINYGSGTADYGSIGLMALPLQFVGAGTLCTVFTSTTPLNGFVGTGTVSRATSSNAGTVTVTAGTANAPAATAPGWFRSLASFNLEAVTGTAHATGIQTYTFNGTVGLPEGQMVYLACSKASVALYATTLVWKEYVVNPNGA